MAEHAGSSRAGRPSERVADKPAVFSPAEPLHEGQMLHPEPGRTAVEPSGPGVLFITGEYPPMVGGLADHTDRLAQAIRVEGWQTAVLTASAATPGTRVLPIVRRWDRRVFSLVQRAVRDYSPAVVHLQYQTAAYGMQPEICFVPFWLRVRGGPPVVVQLHDLKVPYLLPKAGPLRRTVTRALLRWSDGVVLTNRADFETTSEWLERTASRGLLPAGRPAAHLIPIGANVQDHPPAGYDRAAFRAGLGLPAETVLIAFFGLTNQSKGLTDLLRAVRDLRDRLPILVLIVGGSTGANDPTNRQAAATFEREIRDLGLGSIVRQTGTLPAPQVSAHLRAADLAVLPYADGASFRRGSLLAALAHGLPVVTTRGPRPGDRQIPGAELQDGVNCRLVPPADSAALAAAIRALATAPTDRERLATGARDLARSFTWDGIARHTIAAYNAAQAARGGHSP